MSSAVAKMAAQCGTNRIIVKRVSRSVLGIKFSVLVIFLNIAISDILPNFGLHFYRE